MIKYTPTTQLSIEEFKTPFQLALCADVRWVKLKGRFGQAKNECRLNQVRTCLKATAESWIGCITFMANLIRWEKEFFWAFIFYGLSTSDRVSSQVVTLIIIPVKE